MESYVLRRWVVGIVLFGILWLIEEPLGITSERLGFIGYAAYALVSTAIAIGLLYRLFPNPPAR